MHRQRRLCSVINKDINDYDKFLIVKFCPRNEAQRLVENVCLASNNSMCSVWL